MKLMRFNVFVWLGLISLTLLILLAGYLSQRYNASTFSWNAHSSSELYSKQHHKISFSVNPWALIGYTDDERTCLRRMSVTIATRAKTIEDDVPTVPCLSADGHLLVLSAGASRVRYGMSVTFVMVYPTDIQTVLPKHIVSHPLSSHEQRLWCIFTDGSIRPTYSYDSKHGNDRVSLLDCPLSPFASEQLWKYNGKTTVYLASTTSKNRTIPILKAVVNVPIHPVNSLNTSRETFTLCTSPLHNKAAYLVQWIEFHRLVGFQKFVIYNSTDANGQLSSILAMYTQKYPGLIDVVQWNFSSLVLGDVLQGRYFQVEALHDCLIRYGDQSEWLGTFDLDEYIVPLHPYESVVDYVHDTFGRRPVGSMNMRSLFFCTKNPNNYSTVEDDMSRLTIERFTFRARNGYKRGNEKYLYRPRFVQYLSIHRHLVGLAQEQSSEDKISTRSLYINELSTTKAWLLAWHLC